MSRDRRGHHDQRRQPELAVGDQPLVAGDRERHDRGERGDQPEHDADGGHEAGLGEHRALTCSGVAPSSRSRASSARRWAITAAKALTTMIAANSEIMPTTTLLSRLIVSPSGCAGGQGAAVDPDQHQGADGRGEHDHRGEHAGEQVRATGGVVAPPAGPPRPADTGRASGRAPAQQHRRQDGQADADQDRAGAGGLIAAYGSRTSAVTVMVTTRHATP